MSLATSPRAALLAALSASAFAIAGCGSGDGDSTAAVPATPAQTSADSASMEGMEHGTTGGSHDMAGMGEMTVLASATREGVKLGLEAMAPETFFVSDGVDEVEHAPKSNDSVHLMVTLADADSGIRLPDASVTIQVKAPDGTVAFDGPLYPMIGRGVGLHYGENIALPEPGNYSATLVAGPARVGRHTDVKSAWTKTIRLPLRMKWDGTKATAAS